MARVGFMFSSAPLRASPAASLFFLVLVATASATSIPPVDSRLAALEARFDQQQKRLVHAEGRVADLERVAPKEFEVIHFNVLADQAGTNRQPWFCYGADITPQEREDLHTNFYASGDDFKRMRDKGWPRWAEGVLSSERIAAVERYDEEIFRWELRSERLFQQCIKHQVGCRERSPDVITLAGRPRSWD